MLKRISKYLLLFALMFTLVGCGKTTTTQQVTKDPSTKEVQIIVYDKTNTSVYDQKKETTKKYLIEVLKSIDELDVKTQDSQYGEFITSIKGYEQGDNYYWNYYVNGEYAQVGASNQEVKNNDVYTFKLEKFV